ncbi:cell cycle checkpoint [Abortiporus biennis]|nr:cell cycle checkpoint [Abortiporus biennis]
MRFRAEVEHANTFSRIIQSINKLQSRCTIKFTEDEMHIICLADANEGNVQIWSQVRIASIFSEYRIQSNANNNITIRLSTDALLGALHSVSNPSGPLSETMIVMKLAKKSDQAVLSFEITGFSKNGKPVRVSHDVRIEVVRPAEVDAMKEPMCPEPDVHVILPPLSKLRTVVEKLRSLSDVIKFQANNSGKLTLSVSTDSVKMDVDWNGLSNPTYDRSTSSQSQETNPSQTQRRDPNKKFGILVSIKSFLKFLNSYVLSSTTIACLCQNHCLILYVYIGEQADNGGVLTFFIPAMIDDDF